MAVPTAAAMPADVPTAALASMASPVAVTVTSPLAVPVAHVKIFVKA